VNLLDLIIILLVLAQAIKWAHVGFFRGFFSLSGLLTGIGTGLFLAPYFIRISEEPFIKFSFAVFIIIVSAAVFSAIGKIIGTRLSSFTKKFKLGPIDSIMGATFSAFVTLGVSWLLLSVLAGGPYPSFNQQIRDSAVMQSMDETLPPAPSVFAGLGRLLSPNLYPQVFIGIEPRPVDPIELPAEEDLLQALRSTEGSVVRIESIACGGLITGTGFVVGDNLVMTNAHVVAGTNQPTIVDSNGTYRANTVVFDPVLDIAVLRADGIGGEPLLLADQLYPRGTLGATLGYPGGGPLEVTAAGVLREMNAVGRDIYGNGLVMREIYELQTTVVSGNSGGPVVLPNGKVIGVIFARSESANNIGYALTASAVAPLLDAAEANPEPVSTGRCVR
jgi:S1-C subfamily serine protease